MYSSSSLLHPCLPALGGHTSERPAPKPGQTLRFPETLLRTPISGAKTQFSSTYKQGESSTSHKLERRAQDGPQGIRLFGPISGPTKARWFPALCSLQPSQRSCSRRLLRSHPSESALLEPPESLPVAWDQAARRATMASRQPVDMPNSARSRSRWSQPVPRRVRLAKH
jgi:hypothetical protein